MIGKRVKDLRLERGISLSELAESAGVAKSYLSMIERDIQTNPSIHFLEKLAKVLRVNVEYLLHSERGDDLGRMADDFRALPSDWIQLIRGAISFGVSKADVEHFIESKIKEMSDKTDK
ncbi:helix-turn-helix domain-containing protein [Paenibacillus ginsengarvi]|uniref:XRE family transcriptional regulator n=1 Tax=Paenibacillus ginsengarvi TaxID=400777 RepID=A0A3B0CRP0_9BACL|nr:helix-turn-helix transcriptional regulator [Paenibacillus ginsengarvi]RKN86179.1 XRE family transcriptional regulator [Paenibacillus ginsengarvi]